MFRKSIFYIGTILPILVGLQAKEGFLEAKATYFYPDDSKFKEIYSHRGGIYGVEVTQQIWKRIYIFGSADYFHKHGASIGENDPADITFFPIGLGVKYLLPAPPANFYLGAGVLATYLSMHDHSPFVAETTSKWGFGGIFKAGIIRTFRDHLFIDIFASYSSNRVNFSGSHNEIIRSDADLSGWGIGLGFGYRWK